MISFVFAFTAPSKLILVLPDLQVVVKHLLQIPFASLDLLWLGCGTHKFEFSIRLRISVFEIIGDEKNH